VVEQVAGTVVIHSTSANTAVTCVAGGYITVKEIKCTRASANDVRAVYAAYAAVECTVIAEAVTAEATGAPVMGKACWGVQLNGAGALNVFSNCEAIGGYHAYAVAVDTGDLIIEGNCEASGDSWAVGAYPNSGSLYVHGNCSANGGFISYGALCGNGDVTIWGQITTAAATPTGYGIDVANATVIIYGHIRAFAVDTCYGIQAQSGLVTIYGNAEATVSSPTGLVIGASVSQATVIIEGDTIGTGGNIVYGAEISWSGTLTVLNGRASGATFDLSQTDGTLQIFSVDHDTSEGTITWLNGNALESLRDYARGSIIRGGAADWEALNAKTDKFVLIGDGTDVESRALTAADIPTEYVRRDGTLPLTADWDAGAHKITAEQLASDIAIGAAPLIVASTTVVANLNADLLDGQHGAYYAPATAIAGTAGRVAQFAAGGAAVEDANLVAPAANLLTLAAGGAYTLTVPETLIVAGQNVTNTFTAAQTFNENILQADGKYISTDQVRARDGDGLKLYDDGGNGIFVKENVGIGTDNPTSSNGGLDIASGGKSLILGADNVSSTRTNSTAKYARIGGYHYTNAQAPYAFLLAESTSVYNTLYFGGGSGLLNAVTGIRFYTAPNNTTTTGTERMRIIGSGLIGINKPTPLAQLHTQTSGSAVIGQIIQLSAAASEAALEVRASGGGVLANISQTGGIFVSDKIIFTQVDENEKIDSIDNYMTYWATLGHNFNAPITLAEKTLLAAPVAGTLEYNGKFHITNNGKQKVIDRTSDVAVATVTVANTVVETTMWTAEMLADSLEAGNVFEFVADGSIDSASASDTVTIRIKVGGVTKVTLVSEAKNITNGCWHIRANATQRTLGVAGSRAIHIDLVIDSYSTEVCAVAAIDTTANMDVTVTAQWNNAKAGNTISMFNGFMKYRN